MTALKAAIADKERTKASGNYVNADQENVKRMIQK